MKTKIMIAAAALACSTAFGITIDSDVYFAFSRDKDTDGRFSFALSQQSCSIKSSEPGQWKKASIYVDTGYGVRTIEGCWSKDKPHRDNYGRPMDLKICGIVDGAFQTPCREDSSKVFIRTTDLPRAPSRADF